MFFLGQRGVVLPAETYGYLLQGCSRMKALDEARRVHAHIVEVRLESSSYVGNSIVSMFVGCGSLPDGLKVFDRLPQRSTFTWTSIISGLVKSGQNGEALKRYHQMVAEGANPDKYTYVSVLRACSGLADLQEGKRVHVRVVKDQCELQLFVATALVDMYAKCGSMVDAQEVFDRVPKRNVVVWSAMISGYAQQGEGAKGLQLFEQMQREGVRPDDRAFISALKACGSLSAAEEGVTCDGRQMKLNSLRKVKEIHAEIGSGGFGADVFLGTTLVDTYAKCGSMLDAQRVFDDLHNRNVVSWSALIGGYAQQEQGEAALQLYHQMKRDDVKPNTWTFVSVLKACGSLATVEESVFVKGQLLKVQTLKMGHAIHGDVSRKGYESDVFVGTALVDMYAKCGSMVDAKQIFDKLCERDVVCWNAMMAGYAQQDHGEEAMQLYAQMQEAGVMPTSATFISLLKACSNIGALNMCTQVYHDVLNIGMDLNAVSTSLVHAFGKCGCMDSARVVFDSLPRQDVLQWSALIAGYARQGEHRMALNLFNEMQQAGINPNGVTFVSILTACGHAGLVDDGLKYFNCMTGEYGIPATIQHYASLLDMLARAGCFDEVQDILSSMSIQPNLAIWLCLLGACRKFRNVQLGRRAFDSAVSLEPKHSTSYIVMSDIYAEAEMWKEARTIDEMRAKAGAWKQPGKSWIELGGQVHVFVVQDRNHKQKDLVYARLRELRGAMSWSCRDQETFTAGLKCNLVSIL